MESYLSIMDLDNKKSLIFFLVIFDFFERQSRFFRGKRHGSFEQLFTSDGFLLSCVFQNNIAAYEQIDNDAPMS